MTDNITRRTAIKGLGGTLALTGITSVVLPNRADAAGAAAPRRPVVDAKVESRARALLAKMTVREKLGQLQQSLGGDPATTTAAGVGEVGLVLDIDSAAAINALQKLAVEKSRLGIPILFGLDVIHGFVTTFPIPLAQGSSFDPETAETDASVGAREARASGISWTFAPMVDVTHEPRWGRIAEGYGEDPFLAAHFATAKVRGYQGDDYSAPDKVVACAKHFVAYGGAEGGRDYNTVDVSEQRLRNLYLPSFRACLDAGVATFMASFNTISGVPAHANHHTLTDILKGEWGFDGFVTSDYTGVQELINHGIAKDSKDSARVALNAGVDVEMVSNNLLTYGEQLLAEGKIGKSRLNDAVLRVLRIKLRAGLFDNPYVDATKEVTVPAAADRALARKVASRSIVLLRNEGGLLPLPTSTRSIAVVGPLGDDTLTLHGTATTGKGNAIPAVSILDGIKAAAPHASITFTPGCTVLGTDSSGIPAAVTAAKQATVTVVVVGESQDESGEASARSDIDLPGVQAQLVSAIAATGRPFVVVLLNGRPLTIGDWVGSAPAILEAWHPGLEGGNAVADVLFGKVNPGAKLPVSFPRSVGAVPTYYNHENTGRPFDATNKYTSKYLDLPDGPLFEFGFGLSYTDFTVTDLALSRASMSAASIRSGRHLIATAKVTNTGHVRGEEVVQLYIRDLVASIVQPVRRLRGFKRVSLQPGAAQTVRFSLGASDLGFWTNANGGHFLVEPGDFEIYAGNSSAAAMVKGFSLT